MSKHLFADCRNRFRRGVSALLGGGIENDSGNLNVVNDVVNCRIIRIAFGNDNARQLDSENSADVGNVDIFDSSTTVTYVVPTLVAELVMVAKAPETKSTSPMLFTTTLVSVEMLPKAFLPSDLRLAGRVISEIASVALALQP